MKISYKWLKTYFDKDIPTPEELGELFTFHFSEVEGIEKIGDDTVLDLKILPDRAHYSLSHRGVAEEVAVTTGTRAKNRYVEEIPASKGEKPPMVIEDPTFCTRMVARYIDNFTTEDSPAWLKTSLEAIGARSINSIVDLTNYVMFDIGQPLHAFDADKIKGNIVVRRAKEGEKVVLLNDKEIALNPTDGVIADELGPLDIAGVKGGKRAEVTMATKRILLVSDNFNPATIRRTATKYDLRNEASKRFENEITTELATHGMNNFCALVKELYPKAQFGPILDLYPAKAKQTVFKIDPAYISKRLGIEIPESEIKRILEALGIKNDNWSLTIPYERLDLTIPEDIVEEVGRIYGYDKIKGILPPKTSKPVTVLPAFYVAEKIKNTLVAEGYSEVMLYTFVPKGDVEMAKPLAADKAFARTNLLENMLKCLERNTLNADLLGLDTIQVFEIGKVFTKDGEFLRLAIGASQVKKVKGRKSEDVLKEALALLNIKAEIKVSGTFAVAEIDLASVISSAKLPDSYADLKFGRASDVRFKQFSLYPFIVRDIALFVPEGVTEVQVWDEIEKGIKDEDAMDWLVRHSLFDVFKKDGKTSYAFRMVFQSMEQTLTDEEANEVMEKVYFRVKEKGWEVR